MKMHCYRMLWCLIVLSLVPACTPRPQQALGTAAGAGIGGGLMALLHAPKPIILAGALAGGALGYYASSKEFEVRNITLAGGQVYEIGQRVGIDLPSTSLFDIETSEFLPTAPIVLDSVVNVLSRYPNHRIVVTAHTNGIDNVKRERPLTVRQAHAVANYLKQNGLSVFREDQSNEIRQWRTLGRANDAPISNSITLQGIRENSHIHIFAYPALKDLHADRRSERMHNIGAFKD